MSDGATETVTETVQVSGAVETPFRRLVRDYFESRLAAVALVVLAAIIALAALAPVVAPTDPYDLATVSILDAKLPPGAQSMCRETLPQAKPQGYSVNQRRGRDCRRAGRHP